MLCRRCGMESSTTDTCEWCNRPMLPAGSSVSGKAARELKLSGKPLITPSSPALEPEPGPLVQQETAESAEAEAAPEQAGPDIVLRPLGHGQGADHAPAAHAASAPAPSRSGPSHGLADQAMQTSVDISQYVGSDQSIFRPIQKDEGFSSAASMDRVAQKKRASFDTGPNWSENDRLKRCAIAGFVISIVFALLQFFISHEVTIKIYNVIPLGSSGSFFTALKLGIVSGIMFGFMLGALLVKMKKGAFIGMIVGVVLGFGSGNGVFSELAGAISGIFAGYYATAGIRRVVDI